MTMYYMDICKGGGGATLGAIAAGLTPIFGLDNNPDIVGVARQNFDHPIIQTDILAYSKMDFGWKIIQKKYGSPDWLHASPPCVNASRANNGKETQEDWDLSEAICRAIAILKPKYFSLENVAGYQHFKAFENILRRLSECRYFYDYAVLDCSDYGIPQSRKRLFLIGTQNTTHYKFWERLKKQEPIGWKEAIADLIPALPECNLTKSQEERIFQYLKLPRDATLYNYIVNARIPNLAIQNAGNRKKNGQQNHTIKLAKEPIWTIKAMSGKVRVNPHQATLIVNGKVLRPSIECYARWQTFPDSYQWSDDLKLNVKICGNAVPPLMMKQIVEAVLKETNHG